MTDTWSKIPNTFSDSSCWTLLVNQVSSFTAKHYWLAIGTFFGFCLRAKNLAAGLWERHCLSHYWLVGTFFLSHVVSVTTDIVSDIILANQHFQRGQVNWGLATLGFVVVSWSNHAGYLSVPILGLFSLCCPVLRDSTRRDGIAQR